MATIHQSFSASFDRAGDRSAALSQLFDSTRSISAAYGFGTRSIRLDNTVRDSAFGKFGMTNGATVLLADPAPHPVGVMAHAAPSRVLPEYASTFHIPTGRSFATTRSRDAPDGPNGEKRYYVQAKDVGRGMSPEMFLMSAPRGAASHTATMHEKTGGLMTPAERREALVFEKCRDRAQRALRKATSDACRLTLTMKRNHPRGVLGVESADCADSLVYGRERAEMVQRAASAAEHSAGRRDNLARRRDSQLAAPLLEHDPHDTTQARLFPRLGKVDSEAARRCEHHHVLRPATTGAASFRSNQETPLAPQRAARTENLNNLDAGGRHYDIISGLARPTPPTRAPHAARIDRRAHPSNHTLPQAGGTAPTLVGPLPSAHITFWSPPSPRKAAAAYYHV